MAWTFPNILKRRDVKKAINGASFHETQVGTIEIPDRLTDDNAFKLASSVSEIYYPIDFIADRISKLRFYVAKNDVEVKGDLARFVKDINPMVSFTDMVYMYIFSLLADGNVRTYRQVPSSLSDNGNKKANVNTISRISILLPDELDIQEYSNVSMLKASSLSDIIRRAWVDGKGFAKDELQIDNLIIDSIDASRRECSLVYSKSPLFKAYRNINNLLAAYSARFNVYVNNGAAGILVRKGSDGNSIEAKADPATQEKIQEELNSRFGVTGNRHLWGISSTPLEFVKTLASISELMPFDETLEDSIKIGGVFQLKPELIPRKDNNTFNNQDAAEKSVWENTIMSLVDTFCANWAKICMLDTVGCQVKADYSTVSCFKANQTEKETIIKSKLENLEKIKTLRPDKESEINNQIDLILKEYGQG